MKTWLLNLWEDPAAFRAAVRSLIVLVSGLVTSGVLVPPVGSKLAWFVALFTGPMALAIPAGQTNRPPGEIKSIANDPAVVPTKPAEPKP